MEKKIDFITTSMYDSQENASNGGVAMTSQEAVAAVLMEMGCTQAEGAKALGWPAQTLGQRLIRGTLKVDDFFALLDAFGIDFNMTVRETGKPVRIHIPGYGRRVRAMSNRVMYDTARSDALSNSFWEDGEHEFDSDGRASELYIDREGRYFFVYYSSSEGERDRVQAVSGDIAAAFISKYGTTIDKSPKKE